MNIKIRMMEDKIFSIENADGQLGVTGGYSKDTHMIFIGNKYNISTSEKKQLIVITDIEEIKEEYDYLIKGKDVENRDIKLKFSEIFSWQNVKTF